MAGIAVIVEKFFAAANALFAILGVDYKLEINDEISAKVEEWFGIIVNG